MLDKYKHVAKETLDEGDTYLFIKYHVMSDSISSPHCQSLNKKNSFVLTYVRFLEVVFSHFSVTTKPPQLTFCRTHQGRKRPPKTFEATKVYLGHLNG